MNEFQFEQFVAQMLSGMKSATDWTIETQKREMEAHDQKLYAAENVLTKALTFVKRERERLRGVQDDQSMRRLHETINRETQQLGRTARGPGPVDTNEPKGQIR
jgi:hypothetical protein